MGDNQGVRPRTLTGFRTLAHQRNGRMSPRRKSPENRKLGPRHLTGTPEAIQQRSTATSWTASGSEGLLSVADLPQRPRMTSPPRVRIEGSRTWLFGGQSGPWSSQRLWRTRHRIALLRASRRARRVAWIESVHRFYATRPRRLRAVRGASPRTRRGSGDPRLYRDRHAPGRVEQPAAGFRHDPDPCRDGSDLGADRV